MNEVKIAIANTTIENFFALLKLDWLDPLVTFEDVAYDDTQRAGWLALDIYDNRHGPMLALQVRQIGHDLNVQVAAGPGGRLLELFKAYLARFCAIEWPPGPIMADDQSEPPTNHTMPDEPQPAQSPIQTHGGGAPRYNANKWLIEHHLDRGRPLPELRAEWLERRKQAGKALLANVDNSMGEVIGRETRRRDASRGTGNTGNTDN